VAAVIVTLVTMPTPSCLRGPESTSHPTSHPTANSTAHTDAPPLSLRTDIGASSLSTPSYTSMAAVVRRLLRDGASLAPAPPDPPPSGCTSVPVVVTTTSATEHSMNRFCTHFAIIGNTLMIGVCVRF